MGTRKGNVRRQPCKAVGKKIEVEGHPRRSAAGFVRIRGKQGMDADMKFDDLLFCLDKTQMPRKRRYNKSETTQEDIMKLREKINDENYLNNAIENMAYEMSGVLIKE